MSTVTEIKAAICSLTLAERAEVAGFLNQWRNDEWDERMTRDLTSGKLDQLLSEVDRDILDGKLHELP